ncbi:hypothetical protein AB0I60_03460 [Actinosynnema sp. NPDC050436]|uniref:hypothetical protein n=1 Tax=Actinosynnema sp. NPDC050436 TaxID=3155659 RepID=UPI0033E7BAA5
MRRHRAEGLFVLDRSALADGSLVLLCERQVGDAFDVALAWFGPGGGHVDPLDPVPDDGWPDHRPTLLAHPAGGCVVLSGPARAHRHPGPGERHEIPVTGVEALTARAPAPRLHGGSAVSDVADWHVVLAHGVLVRELRHTARFAIDPATGAAAWHEVWTPDPADFPTDRFGLDQAGDDEPRAVSVTATLKAGGRTYVVSEGSDLGSTHRYGADFFTCAELDGGRVVRRPHEQSGWKRRAGKHGLRGRFTADGTHLLLTPVFRTGEWKGRQRLLPLPEGEPHEPVKPRGLAKAVLLDRNGGTWWLQDGDEFIALTDDLGR